jgi:hypothetical protein
MNKQRIYDAMLIKAFRADINMGQLRAWLKPYDIDISDGTFERCPPDMIYTPLRVQVMIGEHMRNLADRLWNTEKSEDIKTLDWMAKIKFSKKSCKVESTLNNLKRKNKDDRRKAGFFGEVRGNLGKNNQWATVK